MEESPPIGLQEWLRKRAQPENGGLSPADILTAAEKANLPFEQPVSAPGSFKLQQEGVSACGNCGAPLEPPALVCSCGPAGMVATRGVIVRRKAV